MSVHDVPAALQAAAAIGAWPVRAALFHDLDAMDARLHALRAAFPETTLHAVAIKANPIVALLSHLVAQGAGLEAASWEEVQCALAAGCPPNRLVYDAPVKSMEELAESLKLGLWINADSEAELERLASLGPVGPGRIGIRVNPQLGEGSIAFTSTIGATSKFGVPIDQVPALVARYPFVTGLHVHTGSQGVGLDLIHKAMHRCAELARSLNLQWLDIGGGIPVQYRDHDPVPPTYAQWGRGAPEDLQLITEAGRSVHAPVGWAISRIEAVKDVNGRPTLMVHLGADLLLRRVYQPDTWDHEFVVLDPQGRPKPGRQPTRIAGPLCFAGDILAEERSLAPAEPGDLLWIGHCGAYTVSMWSRHCSRGLPPTIGYTHAGARVLHPGEDPSDVVAFWSR